MELMNFIVITTSSLSKGRVPIWVLNIMGAGALFMSIMCFKRLYTVLRADKVPMKVIGFHEEKTYITSTRGSKTTQKLDKIYKVVDVEYTYEGKTFKNGLSIPKGREDIKVGEVILHRVEIVDDNGLAIPVEIEKNIVLSAIVTFLVGCLFIGAPFI